jgi:putative NIF3 family GTP cyclohydrolase 1 type 2
MARTIQDVIDAIIAAVPGAPLADSVDTFKSGDPTREVTGIVTAFISSVEVLRKAVALGANLIITHEPTYYDHRDREGWLSDDPVRTAKQAFIEQHKLTIWRFHDYWHMHQPDGIITGVAQALGWEPYLAADDQGYWPVAVIPPTPVGTLVEELKRRLSLSVVRAVIEPTMVSRRVGLLVGSPGSEAQIQAFRELELDTIIGGETAEWQLCEYVRDAIALDQPRALILLGHARSEEDGMKYLVEWLKPKVGAVPMTYVPVGNPFQYR